MNTKVKLYWTINAVNVEPREAYDAYNRAPHLKTNNEQWN